jgi:hypothetical protein
VIRIWACRRARLGRCEGGRRERERGEGGLRTPVHVGWPPHTYMATHCLGFGGGVHTEPGGHVCSAVQCCAVRCSAVRCSACCCAVLCVCRQDDACCCLGLAGHGPVHGVLGPTPTYLPTRRMRMPTTTMPTTPWARQPRRPYLCFPTGLTRDPLLVHVPNRAGARTSRSRQAKGSSSCSTLTTVCTQSRNQGMRLILQMGPIPSHHPQGRIAAQHQHQHCSTTQAQLPAS